MMASRSNGNGRLERPWAVAVEDVLRSLDTTPAEGLSGEEARKRFQQYAPNRPPEAKPVSGWVILLRQFKNLIVAFLAAATVVSFAFGEVVEALAIAVVIIAAIGFVTELKGTRSVEAL